MWKNNFQFDAVPHLINFHFVKGANFSKDAIFPLLKLSEKDEKAFTSSSLKEIDIYFVFRVLDEDHPILYLLCQIAKLNNLSIRGLKGCSFGDIDPTEHLK